MPPHDAYDEHELAQYLLGVLPPRETERLDQDSVADDEVAARLRILEDDLVDDYARGALTGETLKRFESHYLGSPTRRARVAFARRFVRAVDRASAARAVETRSDALGSDRAPDRAAPAEERAVARTAPRLRLLMMLSIAAAVLVCVSAALSWQTRQLSSRLDAAATSQATLDRRARELERQIDDLRAANAAVATDLARARSEAPTATPQPVRAIALVLPPQTRAVGPVPALAVPAGADRVGFALRLESHEAVSYQAALKDPADSRIVWRSSWTTARTSDGEWLVFVDVPAGLLKTQHYSFDLTVRDAAGTAVVGSYVFEIVPQ